MASSTVRGINIPDKHSHSHTNFKVAKFCHTWKISNFSFCEQEVGQCLISSTFPVRGEGEHDTTEWCLKLYPNGRSQEYGAHLSLFITLLAAKKSEVKGMFTIGIVHENGARHIVGSSTRTVKFVVNETIGLHDFMTQNNLFDKKSGLMQGDNLVMFCEIKVLVDICNASENLNVVQCADTNNHPLSKIGNLFETKKFSDVTITACGKEFQAHKNILAAQSPVFSAMFDHDMEEREQSRIEIIDFDDKVVKAMLLFLYTGKVNNIQETAVDLLAAANKYALEELKVMCQEVLHAGLTIENAADALILADLHSANLLKTRVISFIYFHAADVATTAGFKSMVQSHPSLIAEAFCQVAVRTSDDSHKVSEPMQRLPSCLTSEGTFEFFG